MYLLTVLQISHFLTALVAAALMALTRIVLLMDPTTITMTLTVPKKNRSSYRPNDNDTYGFNKNTSSYESSKNSFSYNSDNKSSFYGFKMNISSYSSNDDNDETYRSNKNSSSYGSDSKTSSNGLKNK
jgi:hypothetical protein